MTLLVTGGCTHFEGSITGRSELKDASWLMVAGREGEAAAKYEAVLKDYPEIGDQALFPLGLHYARPGANSRVDYQKALGYLQRLLKEYPKSRYREEAETLTALIGEVQNRDQRLRQSQHRGDLLERKAETLERKAENIEKKADALDKKAQALEQQIEKMKEIDKSVEAKKRKRPTQR